VRQTSEIITQIFKGRSQGHVRPTGFEGAEVEQTQMKVIIATRMQGNASRAMNQNGSLKKGFVSMFCFLWKVNV
jgi:hypothetical protein